MFSAHRLLGGLSSFYFRVKRVSTVIEMAAFCNLPALCSFLVHILEPGMLECYETALSALCIRLLPAAAICRLFFFCVCVFFSKHFLFQILNMLESKHLSVVRSLGWSTAFLQCLLWACTQVLLFFSVSCGLGQTA